MQPAGELSYPFGLALFTVASQKPSCQVSHREIGLQRPERIVAETEKEHQLFIACVAQIASTVHCTKSQYACSRFLTTVEYREQRPMRESSDKLMDRALARPIVSVSPCADLGRIAPTWSWAICRVFRNCTET